ncbi:MAG: hypothetical protein LBP65_04255 [Puniceicoccales bacterium]|nr:hypothetical protein [Puniceicoccales bacterium]
MKNWTLLLDGAAAPAEVGLLRDGSFLLHRCDGSAPVGALFAGVEAVLEQASCRFDAVAGFLVCRGPGNRTGLRLCKMLVDGTNAILPSRPVISYDALDLACDVLSRKGGPQQRFSVAVAVAKRRIALRQAGNETHIWTDSTAGQSMAHGPTFFLPSPFPLPPWGQPFEADGEERNFFWQKILREGMAQKSFHPTIAPVEFSQNRQLSPLPSAC